ncbi:hypothetical protein [Psychrobacillus sp. FJAT-21963]|uniref:hypothetical protein n=1 Tax=Psychrobacillus sp. FJAT-21963 TaxID=1712028 RepID=UPI0006FD61D5|nr:hypothetical protein [Psychrobacillus sp. FJAT-21963]KQL34397.1 hypothetical protein AN959_15480 [Psychrobacillus sp. FJAT-21963]
MKRKNWLFLIIGVIAILVTIYFITTFNKTDKQEQVYHEEEISIFKHLDFSINEESKDKYSFKELIVPNGEAFLLKYNNNPLTLKKGDVVSLRLDFDEPEDSRNHFLFGYYLNDKFYEVFFDQISNKVDTSFKISDDGEFTICLVGTSASDLTITDGYISIK